MQLKALLLIGIAGLPALIIPAGAPAAIAPEGHDELENILAPISDGTPAPAPNGPNRPVTIEIVEPPMDIPGKDMPAALTGAQDSYLQSQGWPRWVGGDIGVWVSVDEQVLRVIQAGAVLLEVPCATARNGVGSRIDSLKTPVGWHSVSKKLGQDAPWGQVFRARRPTGEIWKPGGDTTEDLVLTRVLLLDGEEPGVNKGGEVDSMARFIYIHGTNDEAKIGAPSSHGCIRLRNDDVIRAFQLIPAGARVLVTFDGEE